MLRIAGRYDNQLSFWERHLTSHNGAHQVSFDAPRNSACQLNDADGRDQPSDHQSAIGDLICSSEFECIGPFKSVLTSGDPPPSLRRAMILIPSFQLAEYIMCEKHVSMFLDMLQLAPVPAAMRRRRMEILWEHVMTKDWDDNWEPKDLLNFVVSHDNWFVYGVKV